MSNPLVKFLTYVFGCIAIVAIVSAGPATWWMDRHFQGAAFGPQLPFGIHCCRITLAPGLGVRLAALQAAEKSAAAHTRTVVVQQAQVTAQAAQHDDQAQQAIQVRYRTIIKEVPSVLTPEVDRRYPLPNGLVRLYDASALGVGLSLIPNPASESDGEPSAVAASAAGTVFVGNNQQYAATAQRLSDLQAWVRSEQSASK